ncbi:MAG TPA: FAD-dependent oxidoreductase [Solirubrobacteraceae bacterium]|nr:FAD-dependent oxidoreductase [Solirubrobacteraceae bacterium]
MAAPAAPPRPELRDDVDVDVCVVGGGVLGLTAALLLAREGARVAVVEASQVGAGVTGHTTAKVTALHATAYQQIASRHGGEAARAYARANVTGLDTVVDLVHQLGVDCRLRRKPAYTYVVDPEMRTTIEKEVEAATSAGLAAHYTEDAPLPFPVAAAVRVDDQAEFHPRRYALALAGAIEQLGGQVFERTRVVELDDAARPRLTAASGATVEADHVVVATLMPIFDRGLFFVRCTSMRSYAIAARSLSGTGIDGMLISADEPTRSIRSAPDPESGGELVIVGGEGHVTGEEPRTDLRYAALVDFAREQFAAVEVPYRWSAHDLQPADGLPYVGRLSAQSERIWTAAGFRKWGFTNATAAAIELTARIGGREVPWGDTFAATRITPVKSARGVAAEAAKDARHLVGDRLSDPEVGSTGAIEPGEGARVKLDGEVVAASRDDDGRLHVVSAACTHMGCRVAWNRAERSWDCPCHGSRFAPDGSVLQGPAVQPLARKEAPAEAQRSAS